MVTTEKSQGINKDVNGNINRKAPC